MPPKGGIWWETVHCRIKARPRPSAGWRAPVLFLTVLFPMLFISACGFTPLHAPETTAAYPAIDITLIPNRDGHYLRNQLMDRLYASGATEQPRYRLQVSGLEKTITGFGIRKDTTSTRTQMEIQAKMRLIDTTLGVAVLERTLRAAGGFNSLDNQYATTVSEQYTTELLLKELADTAMTEIDLFLKKDAS